jgi:beta-lactam-binding protein with PASTA domain
VKDQNPDAGTTVAVGSAVSITIGTKPKHPCP